MQQTDNHIHLEAEIVKGKIGHFDTFIGNEASANLRLYIEWRKKGNTQWRKGVDMDRMPPEDFVDYSPLIGEEGSQELRSIGPEQLREMVHELCVESGSQRNSTVECTT